MEYFFKAFENYFDFAGRASRKEYWMFVLISFLLGSILVVLGNVGEFLYLIYALIAIIPMLSLRVRRLHDIGNSGWWLLIVFVPVIGEILMFILMCTAGDCGTNRYGPAPN